MRIRAGCPPDDPDWRRRQVATPPAGDGFGPASVRATPVLPLHFFFGLRTCCRCVLRLRGTDVATGCPCAVARYLYMKRRMELGVCASCRICGNTDILVWWFR